LGGRDALLGHESEVPHGDAGERQAHAGAAGGRWGCLRGGAAGRDLGTAGEHPVHDRRLLRGDGGETGLVLALVDLHQAVGAGQPGEQAAGERGEQSLHRPAGRSRPPEHAGQPRRDQVVGDGPFDDAIEIVTIADLEVSGACTTNQRGDVAMTPDA